MRILFAGTPAIAVPSLRILAEMELAGRSGVVLAGILTNPDRRRKRGEEEPSEVSAAAAALALPRKEKGLPPIVRLKPEKLDAAARGEVAALKPDLLVSFAYGRFFGPRFLALFPLGGVNIHPSLLPKYRGASPIPAAILARDRETGICIQKLSQEMDAGDILTSTRFPLSGRETTVSLSADAAGKAAFLLRGLLENFGGMAAAAQPQKGEVSLCGEISKEDGLIDWTESAAQIDARIRAYTPWPLSFSFRGGEKLFILEAGLVPAESRGAADTARGVLSPASVDFPRGAADTARGGFSSAPVDFPGGAADTARGGFSSAPADFPRDAPPGTVLGTDASRGILIQTGDGILAVSRLQWQAKKALDWKAFLNGARNFTGARLGAEGGR